jgi:beta-lactamase regulating signal transducer with metallopeptidase domain/Leucine-rich repeat (LRR) protein
MNALIEAFWQVADVWATSIGWASLVACVAIAAAWAIARWCTFLSPRVVCWIWRLACLKVLLALIWIQPVDLAWLPAQPATAIVAKTGPLGASHWVEFQGPQGHFHGFTTGTSPAPKTRPLLSILAGLLLPAWLIGVVYCMTRTARQWNSVRRLRSSSQSCAADRLLRMLQEEGQRLGMRRLPQLLFSSQVESPLLVGIWRPTIILPNRVEEEFDETELRLMLAHELAHLGRHDLAWNWLPAVAAWLFFFHPLIWVMVRRWSEAQEAACDEVVIQRRGVQATDYGRLLLKLSACSPFESTAALGAAGVMGAYRNLERRILTMTRVKPFSARRLMAATGLLLIVAVVTVIPWRLVAAEPKLDEEEKPPTANVSTATLTLAPSRGPKPALDPATLAALKRLKELGAGVMPAGLTPDTGVGIGKGWKGTEADLDLIAQVADLKSLHFDFEYVPAEAVAKLIPKLQQPVDFLQLVGLSDERLTALGRLPKCKTLMLGQQTLSAAGFRHLAEMAEGIESLILGGQVDDLALVGIGQIKSLKDLQLFQAKITDAGLAHLAGLEHLEKLKLQDCRGVGGVGYASLSPVKSLRELNVAGPAIGAEATAALAKLTQLETLTLWTGSLPPAGLKAADVAALGSLKNLRKFEFSAVGKASDAARQASGSAILAAIGQIPALTNLSVVGVIADADALAALAKASALEELRLFSVTVSERSLAALGQLKNLKELRLACNGVVTAAASAKLAGLKQLTLFELNGSSLDGTGLKALVGLRQLKTLSLAGAPFTDEGAEALRGFPALDSLNLSATKITDRALEAIATLPNLRLVILGGTQVTADGLMKLRNLKNLSQVTVDGVELSDADLARLRAAMPGVVISGAPAPSAAFVNVPDRQIAAEPKPADDKPQITGTFIRARPQEPKEGTDAATLTALKRLRELGATPAGIQGDAEALSIGIQGGWKGTPADLEMIAQLPDLKRLYFDFDQISATDVGKLMPKLKRPLEFLGLESLSDKRLTALTRLPACRILMLGQETLSAAGFRHLAEMATGVESLHLRGEVDDDSLVAIGQIRSLKELQLQQSKITDAGLAHLAGLDHLDKLLFFECRGIRGRGYVSLAPLKSLRQLMILGPQIDAQMTEALSSLTQLETLSLTPNQLPPAGLKAADVETLKNLKSLQSLSFMSQSPATDAAKRATGGAILAVAGQLPSLRRLSVVGVIADADALAALSKTSHLEELRLYDVTLSVRLLAALGELKNLRHLELASEGGVTDALWPKLTGLTQLTGISLQGSGLSDANLAQLADLTALERLDLPNSNVTGTALKALTNLKQLKSLTLSDSPFSDEGAEALRELPTIEWLNLNKTKITDRALDAIATLPQLFVLNLDNTAVTVDGLMKLRDLKKLSSLSVVGVALSDEEMAQLHAAMPEVQISNEGVFYNYGTE